MPKYRCIRNCQVRGRFFWAGEIHNFPDAPNKHWEELEAGEAKDIEQGRLPGLSSSFDVATEDELRNSDFPLEAMKEYCELTYKKKIPGNYKRPASITAFLAARTAFVSATGGKTGVMATGAAGAPQNDENGGQDE